MTYDGPLSASLMRMRTAHLFAECIAAGGEPAELIFEVVACDDCGRVVNRLRDGDPIGWTTSGSTETGWHDRCRECSR
jgi:hypothetical protein